MTVADFKSMRQTNTPAYTPSRSGGFVRTGAPDPEASVTVDNDIEIDAEDDDMTPRESLKAYRPGRLS